MADYTDKLRDDTLKEDVPTHRDPLAYTRKLVLAQADELHKQYQDFEELIAVKGRELDLLCKARDTLGDALRGTEAVRVEINEALEGPKDTTERPAGDRDIGQYR
jgi:hypothetical protein